MRLDFQQFWRCDTGASNNQAVARTSKVTVFEGVLLAGYFVNILHRVSRCSKVCIHAAFFHVTTAKQAQDAARKRGFWISPAEFKPNSALAFFTDDGRAKVWSALLSLRLNLKRLVDSLRDGIICTAFDGFVRHC